MLPLESGFRRCRDVLQGVLSPGLDIGAVVAMEVDA